MAVEAAPSVQFFLPRAAALDGTIPVAAMVESIVGCKWSLRLLDLRACPSLSAKVMNERLRKMVRFGSVEHTVFGETPPLEVV